MLEYCKLILEKVSFDKRLFEKELRKSFQYLLPNEAKELISWVKANFNNRFPEIISNFNSPNLC